MRKGASGDLALHDLGRDCWVYRGFFSNSCVLPFKSGLVVVDTQVSPHGARRLKREIARRTSLPVRFVVNTHHHGDHTGGNSEFAEAELIGTEETARLAVERDADRVAYARTFGLVFQEWHPTVPPTRVFRGRHSFELDGEPVDCLQLGAVETSDACIVHLPRRRIVCAGDAVSTWDYPFLGTPFLDEGLHDDGEWIACLRAILELEPERLVAGHGPPLSGRREIRARLELLMALMTDLLASVRARLHLPVDRIVAEVSRDLAPYLRNAGLREKTLSQRFAIYRCINSLRPERRGRGWWNDLRPSRIERASEGELRAEAVVCEAAGWVPCARAWLARRRRDLAVSLLEERVRREPGDALAWAWLADTLFDGARAVKPAVDATEYLEASGRASRRALELEPGNALAQLNLASLEVFGGLLLAQPMAGPAARLLGALATSALTPAQRRKGAFFLGKALQVDGDPLESDRWLRRALPPLARPAFPALRSFLRSLP
jgi:glyoxylase-like metal-dependent hydrolase (beta-lactamase superfamily II)